MSDEQVVEKLYAQMLSAKGEKFRERVLAVALESGIKMNDPLFLIVLATGQLQVLLEDTPVELSELFETWNQKIHDRLEMLKRTAVAGMEIEVVKVAERLVNRNLEHIYQKERPRWGWIVSDTGMVFVGLGVGILIGLLVPVISGGGYAAGKPRNLTLKEAELLDWATTPAGQLAYNILQWNSESLSNLHCTKDEVQQAYVKKVRGKEAVSQYCLLRVMPPTN